MQLRATRNFTDGPFWGHPEKVERRKGEVLDAEGFRARRLIHYGVVRPHSGKRKGGGR